MKLSRLVIESLKFYWRTHIGVAIGVAISTAIIVGALVVGESVKYSLKTISLAKLGDTKFAMATQDRYFRSELADDLEKELGTVVAPALMLNGIIINNDTNLRANQVQVFGIDYRFWKLRSKNQNINQLDQKDNFLYINNRLAKHVKAKLGDELLLKIEKSSLMPKDAPMSLDKDISVSLRQSISAITPDLDLGDFSMQSSQIAPLNAYIPINLLQKKLNLQKLSNLMLIGNGNFNINNVNEILQKKWNITDAGLKIQELNGYNEVQLSTDRIFIDKPVADAISQISSDSTKILTYMVNEIRLEDHATPYSMVSAIDPMEKLNINIKDDEIIINSWLADDLKAKPNDIIRLTYFVFDDNRRLSERTSDFRIKAIIPIEGLAGDRSLMPDFPGIYEAENSRNWEAGIPIDLSKIRDKDEDYWHKYRGTPKAFITLNAGQSIWSNRFGDLTAIRLPINIKEKLESEIKKRLNPSSVGLFFIPIRDNILSSSNPTTDFGQLFLGLSFFLIISALILTGLLFIFSVQQRSEEIGTMLALGLNKRIIRKAFLLEGLVLSLLGGLVGTGLGVIYTKIVLYSLSTVWKNVIGATTIQYHSGIFALFIGAVSGIAISILTIFLSLLGQTKKTAHELLSSNGELEAYTKSRLSRWALILSIISFIISVIIIVWAGSDRGTKAKGAFFGAGALLLLACFGISYYILSSLSRAKSTGNLTLAKMGSQNTIRRRGRSLAVIILLASGSFIIIAIGANKIDSRQDMQKRSAGTGGFALYAETTLPILKNLNDKNERKRLGLIDLKEVSFVQMRVREGDDASCLNLNRVKNPRLLGVDVNELKKRGSFTFTKSVSDKNFEVLRDNSANNDGRIINAIGDESVVTWSLGLSLGGTIDYNDERGKPFKVRIVGTLANTILQGSLLISQEDFIRLFPSESGSRAFLIDAPFDNLGEILKKLSRTFQDFGMELTPTFERLAEFNAVQNTYLSIFQMLGGLALILGSMGLGIILLRNVMERRNELALLRAVGFSKRSIQWFLLSEHWLLLLAGLISGAVCGVIAVIPSLSSNGLELPYFSLSITLVIVALSGFLWTWLAVSFAIRGDLLSALRNE